MVLKSFGQSLSGWSSSIASCSILASPSVVLRPNISPGRLSLGDSDQEGPSLLGSGHDLSPLARDMGAVGLPPKGYQLINTALSSEVVETILNARAPSTRNLHALKWLLFDS